LNNVYFDTCVYHQPGIDLLLSVLPSRNVLFASETFGAVNGIDPRSGHHYDHTRRYIDGSACASDADRSRIYQDNALGVYPRLKPWLCSGRA
jgi:4-oxalmesaconate hydratase